jgi:hypothetical protein
VEAEHEGGEVLNAVQSVVTNIKDKWMGLGRLDGGYGI